MIKTISKAIFLMVLTTLISCAVKKINIDETTNEEISPKLIFLNYLISKENNGKKNIEFIDKKITDGKLKININNYLNSSTSGDLECIQLDENYKKIASVILKNPLSKHIEFVNDSLIFDNKKIELTKASFSLRLQLHSQTKFIAIKEIIDSLKNTSALIITKID